jgi:hypothetical protein
MIKPIGKNTVSDFLNHDIITQLLTKGICGTGLLHKKVVVWYLTEA